MKGNSLVIIIEKLKISKACVYEEERVNEKINS